MELHEGRSLYIALRDMKKVWSRCSHYLFKLCEYIQLMNSLQCCKTHLFVQTSQSMISCCYCSVNWIDWQSVMCHQLIFHSEERGTDALYISIGTVILQQFTSRASTDTKRRFSNLFSSNIEHSTNIANNINKTENNKNQPLFGYFVVICVSASLFDTMDKNFLWWTCYVLHVTCYCILSRLR